MPYHWERKDLLRIGPFGPEALFLDSFSVSDEGRSGVGALEVTDAHCSGHFKYPGLQIFPGFRQIEGANQPACFLWLSQQPEGEYVPLLQRSGSLELFLPAFPGDQLVFRVYGEGVGQAFCKITHHKELVALITGIKGSIVPRCVAERLFKRVK